MSTLVTERPAEGTTPDWSFPTVERHAGNGVEVVAAHLTARPLVHAVVLLDTGATADPAGLEGAASLLGSAVLRGAGGLDEHALAVAFERVGAVPSVAVRYERTELSFEVPAALLSEAFDRLADVLRTPTLAANEVTRVRDARVDSLRARRTDSGFRASRAASHALWAPTSRYAISGSGEVDTLTAIAPDAIAALHRDRWASAPVTVVLAGDLTGVDPAQVVRPLAGGTAAPPTATTTADPADDTTRIHLVDVPGAVQSVITARAPGPAFGVGDDAALEVATTALFGSFSSRLNLRLREELGYTYGASGGFVRMRDGGWSQAGCSVRTEVTADAVGELVGVLRTALDDGLSDEEVAHARDNLVRKFAVRYDGPGSVAMALVRRAHHELPDDERDQHLDALRVVDADGATAAIRSALATDALAITVAAAADEVRAGLADLELGPVHDTE